MFQSLNNLICIVWAVLYYWPWPNQGRKVDLCISSCSHRHIQSFIKLVATRSQCPDLYIINVPFCHPGEHGNVCSRHIFEIFKWVCFFFNLLLIFPCLLPLSGTCLPCYPLDLLCSQCHWSPFCNRENISVRMLTPSFSCSQKFFLYKRCIWSALQNISLTIFAAISLLHYCCYLCSF